MDNLSCRNRCASSGDMRCQCTSLFGGRFIRLPLVVLIAALSVPAFQARAQNAAPPAGAESTVQLVEPPGPGQSTPPVTITLQDALDRARKNDAGYLAAVGDAKSAHEDRQQARNAMLPSLNESTQYLNTQANGAQAQGEIPEGRFVTNDGVHVYREWAVLHQDLSPNTYMLTGIHRADALEAIAKAKSEIARRGLTVTVTRTYYNLAVSQRNYSTAQQALDTARRFMTITEDEERAGQAAHSDVVKAQIQFQQQQQAFDEARLSMEGARLDLAVLLFPTLNENFTIVDDMDSPVALPPFTEVQGMAEKQNPELRVAEETLRAANLDVSAAKNAFLPSLSIDADWGIEANHFALNSTWATHPNVGPVPTLGYFLTAALNIPVWDWGTLHSRLHQTEYRQQQARMELSQTQRQMLGNLYSFYNEAAVARNAVDESRRTADLAAESLRLVNLRYQAGASTVLEVVDAENTLATSRNAYSSTEARYRLALANLQTLTGNF
ncbi:MAG: TolC family protein [Candidatus Acidiferrales bacterium]